MHEHFKPSKTILMVYVVSCLVVVVVVIVVVAEVRVSQEERLVQVVRHTRRGRHPQGQYDKIYIYHISRYYIFIYYINCSVRKYQKKRNF